MEEGHFSNDNECYSTLEEAKAKCLEAKDCKAIATQKNFCGGKFRVTHGGPTFKFYPDTTYMGQELNMKAYEYTCNTGNL